MITVTLQNGWVQVWSGRPRWSKRLQSWQGTLALNIPEEAWPWRHPLPGKCERVDMRVGGKGLDHGNVGKIKRCSGCDQPGHNIRTCTVVSDIDRGLR